MRRTSVAIFVASCTLAAFPGSGLAAPGSAHVAALQVALWRAHLYAGPIDGIAGPLTRHATRVFQKRARLLPDGVAGRHTRHALGRFGRPLLGTRVLGRGMAGWDVSEVQYLLRRNGAPGVAVSGVFGPRTEALVRGVQRAKGLAADGLVGPATLRALRRRGVHTRRGPALAAIPIRTRIDFWALHYGVNPRLARAVAFMESGYQTNLTSPTGAWGVFQVEPGTWSYVEDVLLARQVSRTTEGNVRIGVAYLHHLLRAFRGDRLRALAAWYQGPAYVHRHGISRGARVFARNVLALEQRI
jgi:hypothetical protein